MSKHTPALWMVKDYREGAACDIRATFEPGLEAAIAKIVLAVNSYETLLKAAKDLAERAERCQRILRERDDVRQVPPNPGWNVLDTKVVRAAIAEADKVRGR